MQGGVTVVAGLHPIFLNLVNPAMIVHTKLLQVSIQPYRLAVGHFCHSAQSSAVIFLNYYHNLLYDCMFDHTLRICYLLTPIPELTPYVAHNPVIYRSLPTWFCVPTTFSITFLLSSRSTIYHAHAYSRCWRKQTH